MDQQMARHCYMASLTKSHGLEQDKIEWGKSSNNPSRTYQMIDATLLDVMKDNKQQPKPKLELEDTQIYGENDNRIVHIKADLHPNDKSQLIFAWSMTNMPRININMTCHKLSINLGVKLVHQKKKKNHRVKH